MIRSASSSTSLRLCASVSTMANSSPPMRPTWPSSPTSSTSRLAIAKRLVDEVGLDGHVGRMGGDEFAIVLTDAQSRKLVEELAERIIKAIKEPYMIDQTEIRIGVSIV